MSLPALAAGAAVSRVGLVATAQVYGTLVAVLAVCALIATLSRRESAAALG